jgi:hypothetical protein
MKEYLLQYTKLSIDIINVICKYDFKLENLIKIYNKHKHKDINSYFAKLNIGKLIRKCINNGYTGFYHDCNDKHVNINPKEFKNYIDIHFKNTIKSVNDGKLIICLKNFELKLVSLYTLTLL